MAYRPQFDRGLIWPPLAALIPATGYAAIFAVLSIIPPILITAYVDDGWSLVSVPESLADLGRLAIMMALLLIVIAVIAFVIIAVALLMIGVPTAWLIGDRIRHPASLFPAMLAAMLALWIGFGRPGSLTGDPLALALSLWCACGSAVIYRHFLIRFHDEIFD